MKIRNPFSNLTKSEWILWGVSVTLVLASFFMSSEYNILTLISSLIGVTALILIAKGDVWGQVLTVAFSLLYGIISFQFTYYGEMITYVGMTAPIAVLSIISWVRNPFKENHNEVKVAKLTKGKIISMIILSVVVTSAFYFILKYFDTANLFFSTVSITTSFLASYLMFCRSSYYALAYAGNDIVLIILWTLATIQSVSYFPMIICFVAFFINDIYGFYNWKRIHKRQNG